MNRQEPMMNASEECVALVAGLMMQADGFTGDKIEGIGGNHVGFFVLNPGYHDGKRGSFIGLPELFYGHLLTVLEATPKAVLGTAMGRTVAVTDRGMVCTIVHDRAADELRICN